MKHPAGATRRLGVTKRPWASKVLQTLPPRFGDLPLNLR